MKLSSRVVAEEDKLAWTEAFIESYGAIKDLNPYWEKSILEQYVDKLGNRVDTYVDESEREWEKKQKRQEELADLLDDTKKRIKSLNQ